MIEKTLKTLEETENFAKAMAQFCRRGDVILLYGTLGAGKTAFARAFIQSLTSQDENVPSPTFTLLQTYEGNKAPLFHFDLYRLEKKEEVYELGIEDAFYEGISLIEWPEKIEKDVFAKRVIEIHFDVKGTTRYLTIKGRKPQTEEELFLFFETL